MNFINNFCYFYDKYKLIFMEKIKTIFISDTHTKHKRLTLDSGDLLIFSGDCMSSGFSEMELLDFISWLNTLTQNYKYIVVLSGNHDRYMQAFPKEVIENLFYQNNGYEKGIRYIQDELIELDFENKGKLKIYGTPYQPYFYNWAWNISDSDKLYNIYNNIPENIDLLVTHCPSYGILDKSHVKSLRNPTGEEPLGSKELQLRLSEMTNPPKYHCFGHIHGDGGKFQKIDKTTYINASVCDEMYNPINKIITLDIETKDED